MQNTLTKIEPNNTSRIETLDWQRGMLALSIMAYHLYSWHINTAQADTLIGRLGIYGVSMFFILSGLSMAIAYNKLEIGLKSSAIFFIRRIFRIWPILWVAIILVTAAEILSKQEVSDPYKIFLNLTTLFGFLDPSAYINTGAWSIGNEIVYYSLTPAIIFIYKKKVWLGNLLLSASIIIGGLFATLLISPNIELSSQWSSYINPFNNLFFYISGFAIYYNTKRNQSSTLLPTTLIAISICTLILYPATGDQANIVTNFNRIIFSLASLLMVFGFFKLRANLPKIISFPLEKLGTITYGVYLLHPIVNLAFTAINSKLGIISATYCKIFIISGLTIVLALASYEIIEKPMIKLGKRLTADSKDFSLRKRKIVS
ncbi:exopolysaccharide production protein ExoZ [Pseudomonas protegens]|uniref:acyltransferase family protein n=1 Tax=Pseudomonas protegens TaxID=380021 RepID=UPI003513F609